MDRPYSLRELREGISQLGEWDVDANKVTVMVPDSTRAGPASVKRDDLATTPLRPVLFVYRGDDLVFEGECLVDLEGLEGREGADLERYVAGWIERSALPPNATARAEVTLAPRAVTSAPAIVSVRVMLRR